MLSVIADQLRYPSAHTLFFVSFILLLFSNAIQTEVPNTIPERIARVLLERVLVLKPHPWGLLLAFIEMLDNEQYGFWNQPFVRAEEEIYMMFVKAQENFPLPGAIVSDPIWRHAKRSPRPGSVKKTEQRADNVQLIDPTICMIIR